MDNPWAAAADEDTPGWPTAQGTRWLHGDASWDSSTTTAERDVDLSRSPEPPAGVPASDRPSPPRNSSDAAPETADGNLSSVASVSHHEDLHNSLEDDWSAAWRTTSTSDPGPGDTRPPDKWEAARQEKEKLSRAVPPELLDSLLRQCQRVSQELWPGSETMDDDSWKSGFDDHANIVALLAQLLPADSTLPPPVQFSVTATAKAMNEALKLTRHSPASAGSPLSRLLASRGSLEWERSVKDKPDIVPDTAHVGWRVLGKEDRLEESKPRKVTGGLLSFWNRRASAVQAAPVETPSERSSSPARSSHESVKSASHPPSSRAASPSKASTTLAPPPQHTDSQPTVLATAPAPSAVSRFLNRFSRARGTQHSALALSSDDLEFLSDIVPSASDPPEEDINDSPLNALTSASHSSPLPPKLPPPTPPPPKQPIEASRPSVTLAAVGTLDSANVMGSAPVQFQKEAVNLASHVPVLAFPLSPKPVASLSRSQTPPSSATTSPVVSGQPSMQRTRQPSSQPDALSQSSFTLPLPQKTPPLLSIPPLLPPPPISPPQTPRPDTFPPSMRSTNSSFHDSYDADEDFSAFASFPASAPAPFPSSAPYLSQRPPSPPSPPPRRSYERTHCPSSPSASSILSPASQSSLDQLYSSRSSHSASLDSFDDFVSQPAIVRGENRKHTPSPPSSPVKSQLQPQQLPRLDTFTSRAYHAHTPSQTHASPTVHTSLMNGASSLPSVSDVQHRRTQTLVNHAAARGGILWPNSPDSDEPKARAIPTPPSASTSPKSLIGQEDVDLLGDAGGVGDILGALPLLSATGTGFKALASPPDMHAPFGGGPGKRRGLSDQPWVSPAPLPSSSTPSLSSLSLGTSDPFLVANPRSSQPAKVGGLSAQDLSFFEGL